MGINVDLPPEALSVSGNIHLTGQLLQPSDERLKRSIAQVSSRRGWRVGQVGGVGGKYIEQTWSIVFGWKESEVGLSAQ